MSVDELQIEGPHNVLNALAASAAALACGATPDGVRAGLVSFRPLAHRVEPVATVDGVRYVNDSKATNTDAVEKALATFPGKRVVLLLGGADKGTPLDDFMGVVASSAAAVVCFGAARDTVDGVRYVNDSKATNTDAVEKALATFSGKRVVLLLGGADKGTPLDDFMGVVASRAAAVVCFGAARERFRAALADAPGASEIDIADADDLRDAVDVARSLAQRGDVVLLSPACASFDEFSGFEERGDAFRSYVAGLSASEA